MCGFQILRTAHIVISSNINNILHRIHPIILDYWSTPDERRLSNLHKLENVGETCCHSRVLCLQHLLQVVAVGLLLLVGVAVVVPSFVVRAVAAAAAAKEGRAAKAAALLSQQPLRRGSVNSLLGHR
jgi:hypothetical protein